MFQLIYGTREWIAKASKNANLNNSSFVRGWSGKSMSFSSLYGKGGFFIESHFQNSEWWEKFLPSVVFIEHCRRVKVSSLFKESFSYF